jgi:hypothetical protein
MVGLVMGVPTLRAIFEDRYYNDLEGGILESFGRLFKNALKIYAYPEQEPSTGALVTAGNLRVAPHLRHLYEYLLENRYLEGLRDVDERSLPIHSRDVLARLRRGDETWEAMVPADAVALIKSRHLLGYASEETPDAVSTSVA